MIEKIKTPNTLPLRAFTPMASSAREAELTYSSHLEVEAGKIFYETRHQADIRHAEAQKNTMEMGAKDRELDTSYLVFIAFRMVSSEDLQSRQLWANAFTEKSIELYGEPDKNLASSLLKEQGNNLLQGGGRPELVASYVASSKDIGFFPKQSSVDAEVATPLFNFERTRAELSDYLRTTYTDVFKRMQIAEHEGLFTPADIADTFETGVAALTTSDAAWGEWSVSRREDKDSLSVVKEDKEIIVGMKRQDATAQQVESLFAHEVLRHVLAAVNGSKVDEKLGSGLPNYLDFEEGAGVLNEYALSGRVKDELIDRYTDIALALGLASGGQKIPRSKLLQFALSREKLRNDQRWEQEKISENDLEKKVYAHVNRIYRGTPGNDETIGVFTKDISYLEGFLKAGSYVESELASGKTISQIMQYISQGKFDPTAASHIAYVQAVQGPKISKELVVPFSIKDYTKQVA